MGQTRPLHDVQRPFKIFVSLLDKWEIGYALTDYMILETLMALQSRDKGKLADEVSKPVIRTRPSKEALLIYRCASFLTSLGLGCG
jgi:hypothetical protein